MVTTRNKKRKAPDVKSNDTSSLPKRTKPTRDVKSRDTKSTTAKVSRASKSKVKDIKVKKSSSTKVNKTTAKGIKTSKQVKEIKVKKTTTPKVARPVSRKAEKKPIVPVEPCYKLDAEKATVMACGSGELLQLGIDIDTMISQRPRPVMHLSDTRIQWIAAGGGSNAAIVVSPEGQQLFYTWGCNDKYALGRATENQDKQIIAAPITMPEGANIIQVSIGDNHMAALDSQGRVYTWGTYRDYEGRHYFKPSKKEDKQLEPELMEELSGERIVQIASGENVTLALSDKGIIYIWGIYKYNQKISRRVDIQRSYLLPNPVTSYKRFVAVYSGSFSHFGVTAKNEVYAWGLNNFGQLGLDTDIDRVVMPRHIASLPTDIEVASMAGGHHHTILLTKEGNVYSWGRGDYGQLGQGSMQSNWQPTIIETFKQLPEDNRVIQISSGDNHCTAVTKQGDVYTWGFGEMHQLGHGPDQDKLTPTKINNTHEKSILTGKRVLFASGGGQHTLLVTILKE